MNTDIRLSVDFLQNIKVRKLKKMLGADGVLALIALWTYCAKNHPNGELGKFSPDVELIAEWDGEEGAFVEALKSLRFLDENEDGSLALHDWVKNNPYAANSEERSEAGRLNRLKRENPDAAQIFIDQGRTGITKEEYNNSKYKGIINKTCNTEVGDLQGDLQGNLQGGVDLTLKVPSTPVPVPDPEPIKPKRIGQSAGALSADADPMNEANPVPSPSVESNLPSVGTSRTGAILADKSAVKADCTSIEIDPANDGDFDLSCGPPGRASPPGQKNEVAPDMSVAATPEQIAELWNGMMPPYGFSTVVSLSDKRKRHVKARQREFRKQGAERLEFWRTIFAEVQKIPFMRGENDRGWRADFDFCTESQDKLLRIIEGKYRSDKQVGTRWEAY